MDGGALKRWWHSLATAPEPLTAAERALSLTLALVVAVSRFAAVSRSLWDWDEALFSLAVLDYDVTQHHPHPPGFPLFVAAARLLPFTPFESLRAVSLFASLLLFPSMFLLVRELRCSARIAILAALLLAFLPNVWLYGGTALSDVPAMVLAVASSALLLRGCRGGDGALLAGGVLLGCGLAIRPQNAVFALVPLVLAISHRRRTAIAAAAIAVGLAAVAYGSAVQVSGGWQGYREAVVQHGDYIRNRDSFLAPARPSLIQVADDFFYRPFRAPVINLILAILAVAAVREVRRPSIVAALMLFGPFAVFAWLMLDFHSASRFSIGYMPLLALLAVVGIPSRTRMAGSALLAAGMAVWLWPALRVIRTSYAPPAAALAKVATLDPGRTAVYVGQSLAPHAALLLPGRDVRVIEEGLPAVMFQRADAVVVREGLSGRPGAQNFRRDRDRLAGVVRPRYFEASIVPADRVRFGAGWHEEEGSVLTPYRWMSRQGEIHLPPRADGVLLLRATILGRSLIEVHAGGVLLERFSPEPGSFERRWRLRGARAITIRSSAVTQVEGDPRELALRLDALEVR